MYKQKVCALTNVKELNVQLSLEVRALRQEREGMHQSIQSLSEEFTQITQRMQEEYQRIAQERNNLNKELNELFTEKSEKDTIIKTLTSENLELAARVSQLEQILVSKSDLEEKTKEMKKAYGKLTANRDKYKSDLEMCTNYLLEVEEKC